ncbi:hypothetical protein [Spirosoma flavum]|uniref:Glycosyltransferase RgtA/B/C/D-like domain-containing protein n=1 Tax=Spirosoma flavum TaxID=2048557 RepID=A0ABW6AR89_9BACT
MSEAFSGKINREIFSLSAIPILIFFFTFFHFISNIPFQDDYDALLEPVTKFKQMSAFSWSEFLQIIWTQDDERRIVIDRIAAIFIYLLTGQLDLRLHAFLGLLSLLGILYLIYTIIKGARLPLSLIITSSLLLFQIQYYETIFWAMIPFQHIIVYFFAILSFYFLSSPTTKYLVLSLIVAVLATLSDVSGIFVLPVGALLLLLQHRWKHSLIWVLIIGSIVALYSYNLTIPAFRPKPLDNLQHPDLVLTILLAFSGLSADASTALPSSMRIGLIVLAGAGLWIIVAYYGFKLIRSAFDRSGRPFVRWEITLWGGLFHLGITMLAFSIGRALDGIDAVLISRYKHIGFIWLILIILLISSKFTVKQNKLFSKAWLVVSFFIFLFSYFQYLAPLDYYYKERYTDIYEWQYNRSIPSTPIYLNLRSVVDTVTVRAIRTGVYHLPDHYFFEGPYQQTSGLFPLLVDQVGKHTVTFKNDSFIRNIDKVDGAYIMLKSSKQQHIIPTKQSRYSLKSFLLSSDGDYYARGFTANIATAYLLDDQIYVVYVIVIKGTKKQLYATNYQIQSTANSVKVIDL